MSRCLLALVFVIPLTAFASDLKYTRKAKDAGGEHGAVTYYHQGLRVRIDYRNEFGYGWKDGRPETVAYGNRMATIYQCDMRRVLRLDFDRHQYTVTELDRSGEPVVAADPSRPRQSGAKVKVFTETRDTGETKQVFGQTARRFVTTRKLVPSPGACSTPQESTEDGWYLELDRARESCSESGKPAGRPIGAVLLASTPDCADDFEVEQTGPKPPGIPVEVTITMQGNGNGQHTTTEEVSELSRLPLDPQIFDLPMGYKHVDKLDDSPNLPWLLRGKLMWQNVKSTVWGWTPWGK